VPSPVRVARAGLETKLLGRHLGATSQSAGPARAFGDGPSGLARWQCHGAIPRSVLAGRSPRGDGGLAWETTAAARPYLLAGIYRALKTPTLIVVPTADIAERTFADLSYYLGEEAGLVALVRARASARRRSATTPRGVSITCPHV